MQERPPPAGRCPRGSPPGPVSAARFSLSPCHASGSPPGLGHPWAGPPVPTPQKAGSPSWGLLSVVQLGENLQVLRLLFPGKGEQASFLNGVPAPSHLRRGSLPAALLSASGPGGLLLTQLPPQLPGFAPAAPGPAHPLPLPILLGLGDLSELHLSRKPSLVTPGPGPRTCRSYAGFHPAPSPSQECQLSQGEGLPCQLGTYQSCAD